MSQQLRHTARGIVLHDDCILLMERWRDDLHYFSIPGGGIEEGETPSETVLRELMEETSITVRVVRKVYEVKEDNGRRHHIFLCDYVSGEPELQADSEEAMHVSTENNRFKPRWMDLNQFSSADLAVWTQTQRQLVVDLEYGFEKTVKNLAFTPRA